MFLSKNWFYTHEYTSHDCKKEEKKCFFKFLTTNILSTPTKRIIEKDIKKIVFFSLCMLFFFLIVEICSSAHSLAVSETIDNMQTIEHCRCYCWHLCLFFLLLLLLHLCFYSEENFCQNVYDPGVFTQIAL
jgi:hypothetical protein